MKSSHMTAALIMALAADSLVAPQQVIEAMTT